MCFFINWCFRRWPEVFSIKNLFYYSNWPTTDDQKHTLMTKKLSLMTKNAWSCVSCKKQFRSPEFDKDPLDTFLVSEYIYWACFCKSESKVLCNILRCFRVILIWGVCTLVYLWCWGICVGRPIWNKLEYLLKSIIPLIHI